MMRKYKIASIAYSILLISFLIFIFDFAVDMGGNEKVAIEDYLVLSSFLLHILLLNIFPYLKQKTLCGVVNILVVVLIVVVVCYIIFEFGWSITTICFISIFLFSSFIVFLETLKVVVSINSR